ncbi:filamentous hemagglutinin N-terminal domain-containing protein, partial [Nostoc sp. UIC 10607]|uniref:two-partner secretion domain-containing protein n=1 Tax=Nostoc sp. UIC 10607 TaxID=3045935 RepID=UPI00399FD1D8
MYIKLSNLVQRLQNLVKRPYTSRSLFLITLPLATFGCLTSIGTANGQIIPDNSLGAEKSIVNSNANTDRINGGARRGANLFHSFREFNVGKEGKAYFSNPTGVENIFSRVTGDRRSDILGTLGVADNGNANLFFMNPNGVFFGPDARLDLRGSFLSSTANSLLFDGGLEFSTSNPQAPPMLTVNIPIGLQFRENPGRITNRSVADDVGLQVDSGKTLSLVGGNVNLEGGKLTATGGRIELGGLVKPGTVGLKSDGSLSFPDGVVRGNVSLTNGATVVSLIGQNMKENGADVIINARSLSMSSNAFLSTSTGGQGNSGNIQINATDSISLTSGAKLGAITGGSGNAGNIVIQAKNATVSFSGMETIASTTAYGEIPILNLVGTGQGGDITINAHTLSVTNGATLATSTLGQGNSGNIQINIADSISVTSGSKLGAFTGGSGNAGNIVIEAKDATVSFDGIGTAVTTSVSGKLEIPGFQFVGTGQGGNITINARTLSLTNGAKLFTDTFRQAGTQGFSNAGNIQVNVSDSVALSGGSQLSSSTWGQGNAGKIFVQAKDSVSLTGSETAIYSDVKNTGVSNAGEIEIHAGLLSMRDKAKLSSSTYGTGDAGKIFVQAKDSISLDGGDIFNNVENGAVGQGGEVKIQAGSLSLLNGSQIQTLVRDAKDGQPAGRDGQPAGRGNAGKVSIDVRNALTISGVTNDVNRNPSAIFSSLGTGATGQSGDINITTGSLFLSEGTKLETSTSGTGDAGKVFVQANDSISLDGGDIFSNVENGAVGQGGEVKIQAGSLSLLNGSQIQTEVRQAQDGQPAGRGNAGKVNIDVRDALTISGVTNDENQYPSSIRSVLGEGAIGKGGDINIKTGMLS